MDYRGYRTNWVAGSSFIPTINAPVGINSKFGPTDPLLADIDNDNPLVAEEQRLVGGRAGEAVQERRLAVEDPEVAVAENSVRV